MHSLKASQLLLQAVFFCIALLMSKLSSVKADYQLEVRAHNYSNPQGIDSEGACCESFSSPPGCPQNDCDTEFIFCLRNLGEEMDSDPTNCPLGRFQTSSEFSEDNVVFDSQFIDRPSVPNPLVFTGTSWPGGFQLLVEAEDQDGSFNSPDLVDNIYIEQALTPGQSLPQTTYSGTFGVATISLSFTLTCTSLFGPNCNDLCPPLSDPTNGDVQQPGIIVEGSTATYSCDSSYALVGESTQVCQSGLWSGSAPTCEFDCGPLSATNGQIQFSSGSTTLGSTATYSCNPDYVLQGTATRTCLSTGWSGSAPICISVSSSGCGTLLPPLNGLVQFTDTTEGSVATYSCDEGYGIQASATRTCTSSGWSGSAPTCIRDCGGLTDPANGLVQLPSTTEGALATYTCSDGYTLQGSATRMCQSTGEWSGVAPTCEAIVTMPPEAPTADQRQGSQDGSEGGKDVGPIVGGVVAGIAVILIIAGGVAVAAVVCVLKKRHKSSSRSKPPPPYDNTSFPQPLYEHMGPGLALQEKPEVDHYSVADAPDTGHYVL